MSIKYVYVVGIRWNFVFFSKKNVKIIKQTTKWEWICSVPSFILAKNMTVLVKWNGYPKIKHDFVLISFIFHLFYFISIFIYTYTEDIRINLNAFHAPIEYWKTDFVKVDFCCVLILWNLTWNVIEENKNTYLVYNITLIYILCS